VRSVLLAISLAAAFALIGCGGGVASVAERNRTFYDWDTSSRELLQSFEEPFPPLDLAPHYRGVTTLHGNVQISRPVDWVLRRAGDEAGRRYVEYMSPREYLFSIFEWPDRPDALWRDVLRTYEEADKRAHAEIVFGRIPIATWNGQGREYVVKHRVPAPKEPYVNTSREFFVRNENRIVLVQIVHQGDSLAPESDELLRVVETLRLR
jgi:hypothetical protein